MPKRQKLPSYRLHKARNCAVVTIDGKNHYLGSYDSQHSKEQYARLIGQWAAQQPLAASLKGKAELTVVELLAVYWERHVSQLGGV